ncbi:unnamed protein product, partial [Brassica rapa]
WEPGIGKEERSTGRLESEVRIGDGVLQGKRIEDGISRFYFDLGLESEITEFGRQQWITEIWNLTSILIKTRLIRDKGIIFLSFRLINHGFGAKEIYRKEHYKE